MIGTAVSRSLCSVTIAKQLMGRNFHGVEDVSRVCSTTLCASDFSVLSTIPFTEDTLTECSDTHLLVAGCDVSLMALHAGAPRRAFYQPAWYKDQAFATRRTAGVQWLLVRKDVQPDSRYHTFDEQKRLLGPREQIPHARQLAYAVVVHFVVTGERLFSEVYARTVDRDARGWHVDVGHFGDYGLQVCCYSGSFRDGSIGVATVRKHDVRKV